MWIGYLPFALVILIAAVIFTVRSIRAHRQVNEKMDELENELLQLRAKSYKKPGDSKADKNNQP